MTSLMQSGLSRTIDRIKLSNVEAMRWFKQNNLSGPAPRRTFWFDVIAIVLHRFLGMQ